MRQTREGDEGVIYAWVPADLAVQTKQLAVEQARPVRAVVADALRRYIAHVDRVETQAERAEASAG